MDRIIGILKRLAKLILWGFVLVFGGGSIIMGFNDESNRITLLSIGLGIFIVGFVASKIIDWVLGE
tara:strand:+ start:224 stop:421 length:198 start_codon:yes stop_codon:yes gene_type:complete